MKNYFADLHLHTVLSPCADLLMTPKNIIDRALEVGLDLIAITDHNSAENVEVTMELAVDTPLTILPGMEVETKEEVHLLCLFEKLEQVLSWQEVVYASLPQKKNNEEVFGPQILTNLADEYVKKVEKMLSAATEFSVEEVVAEVSERGGVVIPSHVDRGHASLLSNLGFIPPNLEIDAVEITPNITVKEAKEKFAQLSDYQLITNSDAHQLEAIKKSLKLKLPRVDFSELKLALKEEKDREIIFIK